MTVEEEKGDGSTFYKKLDQISSAKPSASSKKNLPLDLLSWYYLTRILGMEKRLILPKHIIRGGSYADKLEGSYYEYT